MNVIIQFNHIEQAWNGLSLANVLSLTYMLYVEGIITIYDRDRVNNQAAEAHLSGHKNITLTIDAK